MFTCDAKSRRIRTSCASLGVAVLLALATDAPLLWGQEPKGPASTPTASAATPTPTDATSTAADHESLAKKLQNPFADLITFPLQNIISLGVGPEDGRANVLNLQPVVPVPISKGWNLLARPILPVSYSPSKGGGIEWGVGPVLGFPTATGDYLGTGKWTAGPSLAVFVLRGHWALSLIVNQQWSYAGDRARDAVSLLQIQPSLSYILKHGWFLTSGPLISADWTGPKGQKWTVPIGAGVGRVVSIGKQKVNLQVEAYANPVRPDDGPESLILLTGTFLFPQ
jgi:hypothetical protein